MYFAGFLMPKNVNSSVLQACINSIGYVHVVETHTRYGNGEHTVKYVKHMNITRKKNAESTNLASFLGFLNGIHLSKLIPNHAKKSDWFIHMKLVKL